MGKFSDLLKVFFFAVATSWGVNSARAEVYTTFGGGVFSSAKNSSAETRFLNLGYRNCLTADFVHQIELGLWLDQAGLGRKGSGYIAYLAGLEIDNGGLVLRFMVGPALITSPDSYLGGVFQFTEEFFLGVRDKSDKSIGLKYKHLSSGNLFLPNIGRDFAGLELSLSW